MHGGCGCGSKNLVRVYMMLTYHSLSNLLLPCPTTQDPKGVRPHAYEASTCQPEKEVVKEFIRYEKSLTLTHKCQGASGPPIVFVLCENPFKDSMDHVVGGCE